MTFQPTIPNPADYLAQSQIDLRNNFNLLNTYFSLNHIALNAGSDNGKHTYVTYVEQGADPVTAANEMAVYSKDVAGSTRLFKRNESNGAVTQISDVTPTALGTLNAVRDMSGLIHTWGEVTFAAGNALSPLTTFPIAYADVSLTATPITGTASVLAINSIAGANFQLRRSSSTGALTVKIIAVGR